MKIKLRFIPITIIVSTLALSTIMVSYAKSQPENPSCNHDEWLLIEEDGKGNRLQATCVENPVCPLNTAVTEWAYGHKRGEWLVCRPCEGNESDCQRWIQ